MNTTKHARPRGAPLQPQDALDILSSALNYCADANLRYMLANGDRGEGLLIVIRGAAVSEDGERLMTL
jgi:hypothetical protein